MTETPATPEAATEAAPTCYRHTDRETYVRCTRCDRPICPDCMNTASVGFQCPDCVREGNKSVRQARTMFGGRVTQEAYVTKAIIGLCVVAFVLQWASPEFEGKFTAHGIYIAGGEYYRMITAAFLHSRNWLLHIVFNMYVLFSFGTQLERLLGGARFLALYLVAALGGSVLSFALGNPLVPSLGASGAVFGLCGAFFVVARTLRADTSQIVVFLGINLAFGFIVRGIDNWAHIGGLLTGAAIAFVYTRVPRGRNQAALQYGGVAAIAVVLAVVTAVLAADLRQDPSVLIPRNEARPATTSAAGAPSR